MLFSTSINQLGMRRTPRLKYEGALYHIMNRGDRKEAIYLRLFPIPVRARLESLMRIGCSQRHDSPPVAPPRLRR